MQRPHVAVLAPNPQTVIRRPRHARRLFKPPNQDLFDEAWREFRGCLPSRRVYRNKEGNEGKYKTYQAESRRTISHSAAPTEKLRA